MDVNFLQKVIDIIPVDAALSDKHYASQFLDWCEGLVEWTIEWVKPSWATDEYDLQRDNADYYQWKPYLYRFIAKVCLELIPKEGKQRFLAPVIATDDVTFTTMCDFFSGHLVSIIADSPKIPEVALHLLSTITERVLQQKGWQYTDGIGRDSLEFTTIVQNLFFSKMFTANLAARFANGDWSDVAMIMPVFEPILKARGATKLVATAWVTLLESSFEHYPIEHFVENVKYLFETEGQNSSWKHTLLPARMSALIQQFSERAPSNMQQGLLKALDKLVDMGDRRAATVQMSEVFRSVRINEK